MPTNGAAQGYIFDPEDIAIITAAFEDTLHELRLVRRRDPIVTLVAKALIEVAERGERDPVRLREQTLQVLGLNWCSQPNRVA